MKELDAALTALIGKRVTEVIAGGANGAVFILALDDNFSLHVYCAWRLEWSSSVIAGWNDSAQAPDGTIPLELGKLAGTTVTTMRASDFYDLEIGFGSGHKLHVFCDVTPHSEPSGYNQNWVLCDALADRCLVIDRHFQVAMTNYRSTDGEQEPS